MIFISYSHKDEEKVRQIAEAIRFRTDYDLWRDNQIRAGEVYNFVIGRALADAKAVIVFWSKQSVQSESVVDEADRARLANKIIPVKIEDCEVPTGFSQRQTIDLIDFENTPPFGDPGLTQLISELNRFEKVGDDILTIKLSAGETNQYEIMRRVTGGVQIFIGMNSREAVAGMPLVNGLSLIGFTTRLGLEPEEYSGRDVLPILEDVNQSQLIMLTFFPSLLVRPCFYDLVLSQSGEKPLFVLMFDPLNRDDLAKDYAFLNSIPDNRIIRRKGVGFSLEGDSSKETWQIIRALLQAI
jgi:TIR domain